ncbi:MULTISPECIES: LysR family transcriptional regulator [unclassified Serratia (in: enterobacteria)]|uniref:LysR family transcriptional regulator n=1 Tax=unclassified Serratia (in: enterobacteria) TaxID=2647522 RepID=UPI000507CD8C|nr:MULTISPECIES: LysR family transcriptional regulator [unclassified Serratia (in: enterobacteria)]KFK92608.1 LysR family transcriptional regulator [Serratia sp. Ag2]KFL00734.1 LysR family transcriptional regulator [Serratia sp. Ag1]
MDIRRLRYFLVLADELHFGRAANRLAISQPPLSVSIRQLEETIGAKLFERSHQKVRLTAAGEALVPAAQALIERMNSTMHQVRDVDQGVTGHLRIGFVGALLYQGLPRLLQQFQQSRTGLQLNMLELNTKDQLSELAHGSLDVGFVHASRLPEGVSSLLFSSEPLVACLPQQHPLASKPSLNLRELRDDRFIAFSRQVSPYYYDRIQSLCFTAGIDPDIRCEARHWLSVISLVAQGFGSALVPASLRGSAMAGVSFVALAEAGLLSEAYCIWQTDDQRPLLAAFIAAVRHAAAHLQSLG